MAVPSGRKRDKTLVGLMVGMTVVTTAAKMVVPWELPLALY